MSHNHYDHMDLPSLRRLKARWAPAIVTGLGNGAYLAGKGIGGAIELDWWQACDVLRGLRVHFVPAQHWSKRLLSGLRTMLWGGHVVETAAGRVYFAGDTEETPELAHLANIDVAFVPMNQPTETPEAAAQWVKDFKPRIVYPYHYSNVDPTAFVQAVGNASEVRLRKWY